MTTRLFAQANPLEEPIGRMVDWGREILPEAMQFAQDPTNVVMAIAGVAIAGGSVAAAAHFGLKYGARGFHNLGRKFDRRAGVITVARRVDGGKATRAARLPVTLSFADRCMHVQVVAPTRQGKTSLMLPWIEQDLKLGHTVVIIETSGDLGVEALKIAGELGVACLYLNPNDPSTDAWNPLLGEPEQVVEQMTAALESVSASSNIYYESQNNIILSNLILAAHAVAEATGGQPTLKQIFDWLNNERTLLHDLEADWTGDIPTFNLATLDEDTRTWFANWFFSWKRERRQDLTSSLYALLRKLLGNPRVRRVLTPQPGDNVVDLANAFHEGGLVLCRVPEARVGEIPSMTLATTFLMRAMQELEDRDVRRPLAMYLDELQFMLGKASHRASGKFARWLPGIGKYAVAVHVAYQGFTQLSNDLNDVLETNATHKFFSGRGGRQDAEKIQKLLGEVEEKVEDVRHTRGSRHTSVSVGTRTVIRFRKTVDEIRKLRRGRWFLQLAENGDLQDPMVVESLPRPKSTLGNGFARDEAQEEAPAEEGAVR